MSVGDARCGVSIGMAALVVVSILPTPVSLSFVSWLVSPGHCGMFPCSSRAMCGIHALFVRPLVFLSELLTLHEILNRDFHDRCSH